MKKIGRQVHFIPTSENNLRNGEGSFIRLNNGSLMLAYTEFYGDDWEDEATARFVSIVSHDEGETWGDKSVLFEKPEDAVNIMSFSFLRMNNGDIGAFYIIKNKDLTDKIVFTRSADEGKSWSTPVNCLDCLDVQDYYVINNDRVIKLKSGRILLAAARHTVRTEHKQFMPGVICFFYSDDDGYTWQKSDTEFACPFPSNPDGYEEPGLYERADGTLWCYIRTSLGFQFDCFSFDSGNTWTTPRPNPFFSSACSPMLVKDCGELTVAVFNPVPEHLLREDSEPWGRTPYVIAVSTDRGLSFSKENVFYLEDDRTNGYCYPAIIECEDGFLVAYYHSNGTDVCLNSTKIIKITYDELLCEMRKSLETINQYAETYSDPPERVRVAGRGIVVSDGKILLSHELNTGVYMTPGGGLEEGETLEDCCRREVREETGYDVEPLYQFLRINEYSFETMYVSNYFVCEVTGEGKQMLTEIEVEHGIVPEWVSIEDALTIFGTFDEKTPDVRSLYIRELTTIKKYISIIK